MKTLQLAKTKTQEKLWEKLQPVNRTLASDTYKRTMSGSSTLFAENFTCYNLAARKPLREEGANGRLLMAGLEKTLYSFFLNPITPEEVAEGQTFATRAQVKKFPTKAWEATLANEGYLPIDIWALPGGQTLLVKDGKYVPIMSVEGTGALVSHLEAHFEQTFAPIIQATKARLFKEALGGSGFAEFGLRSDQNTNNHTTLMLALYVGGGFTYTSNDQTALIFPEFKDIGTIGHEDIMAYQRKGISLEEAQRQAFEDFVEANQRSALLPDVINTIHSGLPAILALVKRYQGTEKIIMPRFDSGNVPEQCITWKKMTLEAGILETKMVVEDGYNPTKARETRERYAAAGYNPDDIIVGAGGYFQEGCSRDAISLAYKRSATRHASGLEGSIKFSDSPGKESIPGQIRIYERGNTLIVAQAGETIEGTLLSQKVVSNGRIVYNETLQTQHQRALDTWNKYSTIEYSPQTQAMIDTRTQERTLLLAPYLQDTISVQNTTRRN
ncbi:MAG: hypothetical protein Q7R96_05105 [Nanoarchaeota archaeon]|nr:hypothetical protein [Nanoarchaeota archaeon]